MKLYSACDFSLRLSLPLILCLSLTFGGCSGSTSTTDGSGLKGSLYYSNGGEVFRLTLSTGQKQKLFTNAVHPDFTQDGKLLVVEQYPIERIVVTDLSGAIRTSIIEGVDIKGPKFRQAFKKPRVSFNGKYIAYDGGDVYNPITYIIDRSTGDLLAEVGDYSTQDPIVCPSWAPDGSLIVQGWKSLNNGIYKVSPDFSSYQRIDPRLTNVESPSASPDGKYIAFIKDGEPWLMNTDGTSPQQLYTGFGNLSIQPAWSPDSKFLAVVSSGTVYIIDMTKKTIAPVPGSTYYIDGGNQMCWQY